MARNYSSPIQTTGNFFNYTRSYREIPPEDVRHCNPCYGASHPDYPRLQYTQQ
jgi:hypothetical protein